jgi:hypothetical protein
MAQEDAQEHQEQQEHSASAKTEGKCAVSPDSTSDCACDPSSTLLLQLSTVTALLIGQWYALRVLTFSLWESQVSVFPLRSLYYHSWFISLELGLSQNAVSTRPSAFLSWVYLDRR